MYESRFAFSPPEASAFWLKLRPLKQASNGFQTDTKLLINRLQAAHGQPDGFSLRRA
jgi:hypothetical protein